MRCSFCTRNFKINKGKMLVRNSGEILYFCSSKCEKNYLLGRDSKKLKWVSKK
ncbi:MAG: 50S ribosomal protein L24e [Candidatus Aenigmatarchaeota archaeon]